MTDAELLELPITEVRRRGRDEITKRYLALMIAATNGNLSEVARRAKIDRANLRRIMISISGK